MWYRHVRRGCPRSGFQGAQVAATCVAKLAREMQVVHATFRPLFDVYGKFKVRLNALFYGIALSRGQSFVWQAGPNVATPAGRRKTRRRQRLLPCLPPTVASDGCNARHVKWQLLPGSPPRRACAGMGCGAGTGPIRARFPCPAGWQAHRWMRCQLQASVPLPSATTAASVSPNHAGFDHTLVGTARWSWGKAAECSCCESELSRKFPKGTSSPAGMQAAPAPLTQAHPQLPSPRE